MSPSRISSFAGRLRRGEPLVGTWVKLPSPDVCELLASTELDLLCLDAEHAPFDRGTLDACLRVLRAADMPSLVRVPDSQPGLLQDALDQGASGIMMPHVCSGAQAAALVKRCHFGPDGRGYSGSTRAAGFGRIGMADHLAVSREQTVVIAQLEDAVALDALDEITATVGLDALFVGRIDLTVSMGETDPAATRVVAACEQISAAARNAGTTLGMFVGDLRELPRWRKAGATLFLLESDQAMLLAGATSLLDRVRSSG